MRALAAATLLLAGCAALLGIEDPTPGSGSGDACDLVTNDGCASNETCTWDGAHSFCRTGSGPMQVSGHCDADGDCITGSSCVLHICRVFCSDGAQCGSQTSCVADFTPLVPRTMCSDPCDPVTAAGCPTDFTCIIIQHKGATSCIPDGSIAQGDPCQDNAFGCAHDEVCFDTGGVPVCYQQCDPAAPACAIGACNDTGDLFVGSHSYGICQ